MRMWCNRMSYLAGGMQIYATTSESYLQYVLKFDNSTPMTQQCLGCGLEKGSANIFCKETDDKYFRLCGPKQN